MSGEELKEILYQKHITQADLARILDMSTQSLSQTLKAADIKTGFLEKLCAALDVPMSFFYPSGTTINNMPVYGDGNAVTSGNNSPAQIGDPNIVTQLMNELAAQRQQIEKLTDKLLGQ